MPEIGSVIDGKYKILNQIGQGGMSIVYLAVNEKANKPWAIKAVRKEGIENLELVKRGLISEVEILKKLKHKNLPSIVDIIEDYDEFLIVMDYVEGRTLKEIVEEEGKLSEEDVIDYGKQLCDVLSYLHERAKPIIYRDLKPSNIMLRPDGRIILIDFGTAREYKDHGQDTMCLGTQGYAAPEQYGLSTQTDARTDIYSLGATLYHLVTGHNPSLPPYEIYPIRQWDQSLSSGLEEILLKCTRFNPNERYQTCREVLYDLENYHSLEEGYRKALKLKLRLFLFSLVITVLSGGLSAYGFCKEGHYKGQSYEKFLGQAAEAYDLKTKEASFRDAMKLDPTKEDAYLNYLDLFVQDENLEEKELTKLLEGINALPENGTKTYLELLQKNEKGYTDFCYEMGLALFFEYKGIYGKEGSRIWFERALESEKYLTGPKRNRAMIYTRIGEYYGRLGRADVTGELNEDYYKELYEDLAKLNAYEPSDFGGNYVTAFTLYQEITALILEHGPLMLCGQTVTVQSLRDELARIEGRIPGLKKEVAADKISSLELLIQKAYVGIEAGQLSLDHRREE